MYSIDWAAVRVRWQRARAQSGVPGDPEESNAGGVSKRIPLISGTVWALGLTSFLTDISSEMVASVLPVYLVLHLGLSPLAFGVVDGLYQGAAALVRVAAGLAADRWRRHKEVAAIGYGLSAACRLLILAAGAAWSTIAVVVALDRIGKGIRTAPRDALISQRTANADLATAFGVHRSFDAGGAMLGPIVAFTLLALIPNAFDVLFLASFGFAALGVGAILLFVPGKLPSERHVTTDRLSWQGAAGILGDARFRPLAITACVLGLATISDSFVFLSLHRRLDFTATAFPLLYVGTSFVISLLAAPSGRLADRIGRKYVLLGGYGALAIVYLSLLAPANDLVLLATAIALLGAHYAATDGVLTAMAAALLPPDRYGSGLALLATTTNLARLASSVVFGWLWMRAGITQATLIYLVALLVAMTLSLILLRSSEQHAQPAG